MRGVALLWLRIALVVLLIRHVAAGWDNVRLAVVAFGFGIAAIFLFVGLFTPTLSLLSAALEAYAATPLDLASWPLPFLAISVFLAIAVLGPGAYSLDALFFGRKKLTIGRHSS
jgi:hypothetical protein